MKKIIIVAILIITFSNVNGQGIGEFAEEKPPIDFPDNTIGLDIMFSEGGFGFGGFYRRELSTKITVFSDFAISEYKDDREFEYIDPFGQTFTRGKVNRIFMLPVSFGMQYRLFEDVITDNLRPYINVGVGPTLVVTTPYSEEFFKAFGKAKSQFAFGGYVGLGANIGIDTKNLVGINLRYYFIRFFDDGVESLQDKFVKDLGGFFVTINLGLMY